MFLLLLEKSSRRVTSQPFTGVHDLGLYITVELPPVLIAKEINTKIKKSECLHFEVIYVNNLHYKSIKKPTLQYRRAQE